MNVLIVLLIKLSKILKDYITADYLKKFIGDDLNDETINYLKDLEIKTELENLVGIEENILKVQELLKQNERVILISDMYHSSNTIRMFIMYLFI